MFSQDCGHALGLVSVSVASVVSVVSVVSVALGFSYCYVKFHVNKDNNMKQIFITNRYKVYKQI